MEDPHLKKDNTQSQLTLDQKYQTLKKEYQEMEDNFDDYKETSALLENELEKELSHISQKYSKIEIELKNFQEKSNKKEKFQNEEIVKLEKENDKIRDQNDNLLKEVQHLRKMKTKLEILSEEVEQKQRINDCTMDSLQEENSKFREINEMLRTDKDFIDGQMTHVKRDLGEKVEHIFKLETDLKRIREDYEGLKTTIEEVKIENTKHIQKIQEKDLLLESATKKIENMNPKILKLDQVKLKGLQLSPSPNKKIEINPKTDKDKDTEIDISSLNVSNLNPYSDTQTINNIGGVNQIDRGGDDEFNGKDDHPSFIMHTEYKINKLPVERASSPAYVQSRDYPQNDSENPRIKAKDLLKRYKKYQNETSTLKSRTNGRGDRSKSRNKTPGNHKIANMNASSSKWAYYLKQHKRDIEKYQKRMKRFKSPITYKSPLVNNIGYSRHSKQSKSPQPNSIKTPTKLSDINFNSDGTKRSANAGGMAVGIKSKDRLSSFHQINRFKNLNPVRSGNERSIVRRTSSRSKRYRDQYRSTTPKGNQWAFTILDKNKKNKHKESSKGIINTQKLAVLVDLLEKPKSARFLRIDSPSLKSYRRKK